MYVTEKSFLANVANHELTILRDDGLYRHLQFKQPNSGICRFEILTFPGHLVYVGDMGSYTSQRLEDMFEFFHVSPLAGRPQLHINTGYWGEKVRATDRNEGLATFSEEKFTRVIRELRRTWIRENAKRTTPAQRRELWDDIEETILKADPTRMLDKAMEFNSFVNDDVGSFYFQDLWDYNFNEPSGRFVWCCYAIAWGIQRYDETKDAALMAA